MISLRIPWVFGGLIPDACQFGLYFMTDPPGNGIEDVALLLQETALARRCRKEVRDRRQQSIMAISHDEIHLDGSACAQVLEHTQPAVFVLLGTGPQGRHLFVARQVHA